uniref:Uncharacterized protein n=1 Tax=Rhizophora mucronata TaxID=61149 RepID=A0A2P2KZ07_RHIMU
MTHYRRLYNIFRQKQFKKSQQPRFTNQLFRPKKHKI